MSDNLVAQTSVSLKGRVTNNALAPVRNASVHLLSTNLRAITNEEGGFEITDIAPGNYTVQVHAAGFVQQQTTVSLENSFFLDIKLEQLSTYLDEVIVTAQKREEQLRNIPFSLSVISSREARQFRLWNSEDLTGIVPNLYAADPGDNRNVISIRGVTSTSYDPAVVTYVDGVSQFSLDTYIAELLDIERIEVLRGPQGTLYGRNAMGGVINIITKQPGNKPGGFAEVNAGSFGLQRYAAGLRFPLIKNKLYAGVAAAFTKHSGYYTNEFDGSAFDRQKSVTSNYYIRYLPGSRWSLTLNLKQRAARNSGAFPLVFTAEEALQRPFMLTQNNVATMKDNILNASLSVMRAGTAFNFSSQTAWQRNYRYYTGSVDADFSALDAYAIYNNYGRSFNTSEVITQEFKLVSAPSSAGLWKWTAGSYLFMQDNPVKQATRFGQDAKLAGAPDSLFSIINTTTARNYGISFYGQANRIITSKLELIVGLRYDWERKKLSILSEYQKDPDPDPLFPLVPDTAAKILLDAFSPRVGLLFHASEQVNIYFNYGRGYRPG
ncbi:MAG TPA: TonB-dependent receptor, partial [Chitinophagaceae bacterium]|nr:TonB-dependent receptor [Chitinophagaceae bacterium]